MAQQERPRAWKQLPWSKKASREQESHGHKPILITEKSVAASSRQPNAPETVAKHRCKARSSAVCQRTVRCCTKLDTPGQAPYWRQQERCCCLCMVTWLMLECLQALGAREFRLASMLSSPPPWCELCIHGEMPHLPHEDGTRSSCSVISSRLPQYVGCLQHHAICSQDSDSDGSGQRFCLHDSIDSCSCNCYSLGQPAAFRTQSSPALRTPAHADLPPENTEPSMLRMILSEGGLPMSNILSVFFC